MSTHSPEPWGDATTREVKTVGVMWEFATTIVDAEGMPIAKASGDNLRRIVACVNFCRQFPTEWLEKREMVYADLTPEQEQPITLADTPNFSGLVIVADKEPKPA